MNELPGGNIRASDAERSRVADELQTHHLEGRISTEELEQRLARAMAARTLHELAEIVHDLPQIRVARAAPGPPRPARPGPPGIRPFTQRLVLPTLPRRTRDVALDTIAPALNAHKYELKSQSTSEFVFERSRRPVWTILLSIFLFPIGLFALLHTRRERIVISLEDHGPGETMMVIHGYASRRARKAFAQLSSP